LFNPKVAKAPKSAVGVHYQQFRLAELGAHGIRKQFFVFPEGFSKVKGNWTRML
jgi:hypothetical protein